MLYLFFQGENLRGGGASAIHDGQRMLARNAGAADAVAFGESGMLYQPRRGNLLALLERGIAGQSQSLGRRSFPQVFMLLRRDHGVLKERTRTQAIRISGYNQHPFQSSDMAHGLARLGQIRRSLSAREVPLQVGIADARLAPGGERVADPQNDETATFAGVENAGAIAEAACFAAKFANLAISQIEY